ncbi:MAG TPA: GNAT family N-acetyltransferase [Candidatus Limnocylindria bacterium]
MDGVRPLASSIATERLLLEVRGAESAGVQRALMAEQGRPVTRSLAEEEARLADQHAAFDATGIGFLSIRLRETGDEVGYCGLLVGRHSLEEPEIAFEVLRSAQGRGVATEAARALVAATWETGRERLWATTRPDNLASLRVAAKSGFVEHHRTLDEQGEVVHLLISGGGRL